MMMDKAELNRKLADILLPNFFPGRIHFLEQAGDVILVWASGEKAETIKCFSPATDRNHLAAYVLPEIYRRGLHYPFCKVMHDDYDVECEDHYDAMWSAFMAQTGDLAAAALKVLGGGE